MTAQSILWLTLYVELALSVLLLICAPYMLLTDYWAVMNLKRVRDDKNWGLTKWSSPLGYYCFFRAVLLDFLVNVIHMTVYVWELPRELIVTARLKRHIETGSGWRQARCLKLRTQLLDGFDPAGIHR